MNKRLLELAKQSEAGYIPRYDMWQMDSETVEKFAKLIIQECINNLDIHSTCFDGDVGRGIKVAMRLTKEHFESK